MSFVPSDDDDAMKNAEASLDATVQELAHLDFLARRSVVEGDQEAGQEVGHRVGHILHNLTYGWTPTLIMHLAHHVNIARSEAGLAADRFRETGEVLKNVAILLEDAQVPIDVCMKVLDLAHRMNGWADESSFEAIPYDEEWIVDE